MDEYKLDQMVIFDSQTFNEAREEAKQRAVAFLSDATLTFEEVIHLVFTEAYHLGYRSNRN